jgi:hypothetical protein
VSKELRKARWKKETEFWWLWNKTGEKWLLPKSEIDMRTNFKAPAPLATEILEELPGGFPKENSIPIEIFVFSIRKILKVYICEYYNESTDEELLVEFRSYSLPDALAKMWLYLKKENLLGKELANGK